MYNLPFMSAALPPQQAKVAELVDALDLGSSGATRGSSSLPFRTKLGLAGYTGFFRRLTNTLKTPFVNSAIQCGHPVPTENRIEPLTIIRVTRDP